MQCPRLKNDKHSLVYDLENNRNGLFLYISFYTVVRAIETILRLLGLNPEYDRYFS